MILEIDMNGLSQFIECDEVAGVFIRKNYPDYTMTILFKSGHEAKFEYVDYQLAKDLYEGIFKTKEGRQQRYLFLSSPLWEQARF